jgi:predicted DNA-binding transcriptional regulator AlpA
MRIIQTLNMNKPKTRHQKNEINATEPNNREMKESLPEVTKTTRNKKNQSVFLADTTDIKKKNIIEALKMSNGVVKNAVEQVGIHRSTFYDWVNQDEDFAREVNSIREGAIDFVESKMFQRIKEGSDTMIIFYLKTQAKARGYVEKSELEVNNKTPDFSALSTEDIVNLLKEDANDSESEG